MTLYEKTQQVKFNMRTALKTGKMVRDLSMKIARDTYGLGNRLFNFSRERGPQCIPKNFMLKKQLTKQLRNHAMRFKAAKEAKKAK